VPSGAKAKRGQWHRTQHNLSVVPLFSVKIRLKLGTIEQRQSLKTWASERTIFVKGDRLYKAKNRVISDFKNIVESTNLLKGFMTNGLALKWTFTLLKCSLKSLCLLETGSFAEGVKNFEL